MWNGHRVAYICAVYFGRGSSAYMRERPGATTKPCLAGNYFSAIRQYATCLDKVILVCSVDPGQDAHVANLQRAAWDFEQVTGISTVVCSKPNPGHWSYGGWNLALQKHCKDIDFAFLVEDDYAPRKHAFDVELLHRYYRTDRAKESVLICVSHWNPTYTSDAFPIPHPHPACSNGLINVKCFKKHGGAFHLNPTNAHHGPITQMTYLNSFRHKGLSIRNMSADYSVPFHHGGKIIYLGIASHKFIIFAPVTMDPDFIWLHQAGVNRDEIITPFYNSKSGGFHVIAGGPGAGGIEWSSWAGHILSINNARKRVQVCP